MIYFIFLVLHLAIMQQRLKVCPKCGRAAYLTAHSCDSCGHFYRTQFELPASPEPTQMGYGVPPASAMAPVHTDLVSVLALAFAFVGLLLYPLWFGPLGMIAGIIGICRTADNPQLRGYAFAVVGLVLSVGSTVWAGLWLFFAAA